MYAVFPIERSHLADSHFRDTGQNVKYVTKTKKKSVCVYSARKRGPLADSIDPDARKHLEPLAMAKTWENND